MNHVILGKGPSTVHTGQLTSSYTSSSFSRPLEGLKSTGLLQENEDSLKLVEASDLYPYFCHVLK